MLGDNSSASEHIGEATSGVVLTVAGAGAGKAIKSGAKAAKNIKKNLDNPLGDLDDLGQSPSGKGEISETLLSQQDRIKLFNKELLEADKASNPQEALATIDKVMTDVEDRHSGVDAKENPGLKYEGRMYAPREDFTEKLSDGSLVATSKGNVVHLETDGTIKVYTKNSEGQADKLVLEKEGANVDSTKVDLLTQNKEVLDDLHNKVTDELSDNKSVRKNKILSGMNRPHRDENPNYSANKDVVDRMNSADMNKRLCNDKFDCSDSASILYREVGEKGAILEVTSPKGRVNIEEKGKIDDFDYHQVYTDGKYIYDPTLADKAIPLGDWKQHINNINDEKIKIKEVEQGKIVKLLIE